MHIINTYHTQIYRFWISVYRYQHMLWDSHHSTLVMFERKSPVDTKCFCNRDVSHRPRCSILFWVDSHEIDYHTSWWLPDQEWSSMVVGYGIFMDDADIQTALEQCGQSIYPATRLAGPSALVLHDPFAHDKKQNWKFCTWYSQPSAKNMFLAIPGWRPTISWREWGHHLISRWSVLPPMSMKHVCWCAPLNRRPPDPPTWNCEQQ